MNFRCTQDENEQINRKAKEKNMSVSMYLKECVLNRIIPAFVPYDGKIIQKACNIATEINQLKFMNPEMDYSILERECGELWQFLN